MKKETNKPTSQDSNRKHERDNIANNPCATKELSNKKDKRKEARKEHTNHFSSREGYPEKK